MNSILNKLSKGVIKQFRIYEKNIEQCNVKFYKAKFAVLNKKSIFAIILMVIKLTTIKIFEYEIL